MANGKYININYPFKDSGQGFFIDLNADDNAAIKADLMHLILTIKGQRLYNPDFGTNLMRFIFEIFILILILNYIVLTNRLNTNTS